ncbi:MAG: hypothetical protein HY037_05905 [Nitrospirae bacterium]|nr:hypothetical protein [Candidatus Troglogloeales bacterium]
MKSRGIRLLILFIAVAFVLVGRVVPLFADDSNTSVIDNMGEGNFVMHDQDDTRNSVAESIIVGDDNINIISQIGDSNEGYQSVIGLDNLQFLFQGYTSDINDKGDLITGKPNSGCFSCLGVQALDTVERNKQLLYQDGEMQIGIQFATNGSKNRQMMSQSGSENMAFQVITEASDVRQAIRQDGTENTAGQSTSASATFQWIRQVGSGNEAEQESANADAVSRILQSGNGNFASIVN